jgi:hypothetical protein
MLEHTLNNGSSSTKYIAITGVSFSVYRLRNTRVLIPGFEEIYRKRCIYTCNAMDNGCVLECIYIANHMDEYTSFKGCVKQIVHRIKQQYQDLFGSPLPKPFNGIEMINTLEFAAKKYNLTFIIYTYSNSKYEQFLIIHKESTSRIINLLLLSKNDQQHLMFIKDVEILTRLHICPKCHSYTLSAATHGGYKKDRFDAHVEKCDGKFHSKLTLQPVSKPYLPHIFKNPLYAYLLAHGRASEYKVLTNCMTYDFETVLKVVNQKFGSGSNWDGQLIPSTVAFTVKGNSIYSKSMVRAVSCEESPNESKTLKTSVEEFINLWLNEMFNSAIEIYDIQQDYYKSLNLPEYLKRQLINKLDEDEEEDEEEEEKKKPVRKPVVKVLGFNSRKFDTNLFV